MSVENDGLYDFSVLVVDHNDCLIVFKTAVAAVIKCKAQKN